MEEGDKDTNIRRIKGCRLTPHSLWHRCSADRTQGSFKIFSKISELRFGQAAVSLRVAGDDDELEMLGGLSDDRPVPSQNNAYQQRPLRGDEKYDIPYTSFFSNVEAG